MVNYMEQVAKMLGVELDEEFEIQFESPFHASAMFTADKFQITDTNVNNWVPYWPESILHSLLSGSITIKRKHYKPVESEWYWAVKPNGEVNTWRWYDNSIDCSLYKLGNCYKTEEEAKTDRDKWVAFYASDEVLEI